MKKAANILLILCFTGFLLAMLLTTALQERQRYSYYENRMLAVCPVPALQTVLDGSYFDDMETFLQDNSALREPLVKAGVRLDLCVLHRPVIHDVVVGRQALHAFNSWADVDPKAVREKAACMADDLALLRDTVEGYGGTLCYVAVPCQYAFYADDIPFYLNDCSEKTAAELPAFRDALESREISFLDAGEVFSRDDDPARFTSSVDNHYNLMGAYDTCRALIEKINEASGHSLAFPEGAVFHALPNRYLGSYDRKIFGLRESGEALYYAELPDTVPFIRTDGGKPVEPSVYAMPATETEDVFYSFYMGGDKAETVLQTNRPELPSALIYGDSFTNAMECILYSCFDELRSLDLRHYDAMPLIDYVNLYQPDIVICVRDYQVLLYDRGNGTPPDQIGGTS